MGCAEREPERGFDAAWKSADEVKDLKAITTALDEARTKTTLLVLDIDDTLLTSQGFFGSDTWYEWGKSLPADQKVVIRDIHTVERARASQRRINNLRHGLMQSLQFHQKLRGDLEPVH